MFHFLVFGQHFINHGSGYKLLRELDSLPEGDIEILAPPEFRPFVGESVRKNLNAAYQKGTNERTTLDAVGMCRFK